MATEKNTKNIPEGWEEVTLGEVCEITSSKRIFANEYKTVGIPFFRGKEVTEKFLGNQISTELFITEEKYNEIKNKFGVPEENDILLTSVGTLGNPYLVEKNFKFYFKDGNLTWFRNYKNIYSKFLFYWIISPQGKESLSHSQIGSTQQAYTIVSLKKSYLSLPPLPEQQAIASILSSLDDKIELLREQNKTLEKIGENIFKENYELFTNFIKAQEVLEFEKGIEVGSSNYFEKKSDLDDAITFYRVGDIGSNGNQPSLYCEKKLLKNKLFEKEDVLVSFDGTVGRVFIGGIGGFSSGIRKIYSKINNIENSFLYFWAKSSEVQKTITLYSEGTTIQHAGKAIPYLQISSNQSDIDVITKKINPIFDKIISNLEQIQTLTQTRDTILPKLMSGELRVKI